MNTPATTTVGTLVEGAKARDAEAWNRIVTHFGPRIRGYARARGVADPEDLTQDVFVAAAARIGDFTGDDDALRSWLFGIAYRQIVNRYRAAAKQTTPLPDGLPAAGAGPEESVVGRAEALEAVAALDILSDLERDIVLMRVVGELDSEEVSAAVGKRPGNVRVIQSRAMAKLRKELERRGYGTPAVWAAALVAAVAGPIGPAQASAVAAAATVAVPIAGAGAGAIAGISTAAKLTAAIAVAAVVGGGGAAVTGTLPDTPQRWVADAASRIGVTLPRPAENAVVETTVPAVDDAVSTITDVATTLLPDPDPDAGILPGPETGTLPDTPDTGVGDTADPLVEDTGPLTDPFQRLIEGDLVELPEITIPDPDAVEPPLP